MEKYKLVACDLDGTLLNNENKIMDYTIETIVRLKKEQNLLFCVCTGRPYIAIKNLWNTWHMNEFVDYIILLSGALILNNKADIISYHHFSMEALKEILESFSALKHQYFCFGNALYTSEKNDKSIHSAKINAANLVICDMEKKLINPWPKIGILFNPTDKNIVNNIIQSTSKYTSIITANNYVEISPLGITKESGLRELSYMLKIDMKEIIAFGNDMNDLNMLRAVGHPVVMKNGNDKLKKIINNMTSNTNDDNGVAHYLLEMMKKQKKTL